MSKSSARRLVMGITLIEVFAILIFLLIVAAILFPVTACACGHGSKRTVCLSNIKQQALGAIMYAEDYDQRFPKAEAWMDLEKPYCKSEGIYHDSQGVPENAHGYAFRKRASSMKEDAPVAPEKFILIFESTLLGRNATSELWSLPRPGRQGGSDCIAFCDGHAKSLPVGEAEKGATATLTSALLDDDKSGPKP